MSALSWTHVVSLCACLLQRGRQLWNPSIRSMSAGFYRVCLDTADSAVACFWSAWLLLFQSHLRKSAGFSRLH